MARWAGAGAAAVGLLIALLTLVPSPGPKQSASLLLGTLSLSDTIRNILLFAPLGLLLAVHAASLRSALLIAGSFSLLIELTQLALPGRFPSLRDVVANTFGSYLGAAVALHWKQLLRAVDAHGGALSVAVCLGIGLAILLPALLLRVDLERPSYQGVWNPGVGRAAPYAGAVRAARVGDVSIPPDGAVARSEELRRQLVAGAPIRVRFEVAAPTNDRAGLFAIRELPWSGDVVLVGIRARDIWVEFRRLAGRLNLDQPSLIVPNALQGRRPGEHVDLIVEPGWPGVTMSVGGGATRSAGFPVARGWAFLVPDRWLGQRGRSLLDAIWLCILLLPLGFLAQRSATWIAAVVVALLTLAWLPARLGLEAASLSHWLAIGTGMACGVGIARALKQLHGRSPAPRS